MFESQVQVEVVTASLGDKGVLMVRVGKKIGWRKKLLWAFLSVMILSAVCMFAAFLYFKNQFFAEQANTLTFKGDLRSIPFQWSPGQFGDHTEPHYAMLIPVSVPGIDKKFYMQFDTGLKSTFLRSGAVEQLSSRGIELEFLQDSDQTRLKKFELDIGGNSVVLDSGEVFNRDANIDWDNPDSINIIGSIGTDFIDQKVCEIDFPARQIRLHESRPEYLDSLGVFTPFEFKGRRIMLPAIIDGVNFELFYDSGCSAFGLLTSKYHFNSYADQDSSEISYNANRHGDPVMIHHRNCDSVIRFGEVELPLKRVSYAELYSLLQVTVGRLVNGGFFGNKSLTESTLILDAVANEFLIVPSSLQDMHRQDPKQPVR